MLRYILRREGVGSLYRGFPVTFMMNGPQAAAIVCVNETLKIYYRPESGHNIATYFACAAIAGGLAAFASMPLDNIRTRLQTQDFFQESRKEQNTFIDRGTDKKNLYKMLARQFISNHTPNSNENNIQNGGRVKYQTILSTFSLIIKEEGFKGFFKGALPRVISQAPSSAISWSAYEMIKKMLSTKREL